MEQENTIKNSKLQFRVEYLLHVVLFAVLVFIDQITKLWARGELNGQGEKEFLPGILSLLYTENTGAVWGIFKGKTTFLLIFTIALFVILLVVYFKIPHGRRYFPVRLLIVFIMAGAIGNIIDRIRYGFVTDFLNFQFIDFPVFNIADIYITVSEVILLVLVLFFYKEEMAVE